MLGMLVAGQDATGNFLAWLLKVRLSLSVYAQGRQRGSETKECREVVRVSLQSGAKQVHRFHNPTRLGDQDAQVDIAQRSVRCEPSHLAKTGFCLLFAAQLAFCQPAQIIETGV